MRVIERKIEREIQTDRRTDGQTETERGGGERNRQTERITQNAHLSRYSKFNFIMFSNCLNVLGLSIVDIYNSRPTIINNSAVLCNRPIVVTNSKFTCNNVCKQ